MLLVVFLIAFFLFKRAEIVSYQFDNQKISIKEKSGKIKSIKWSEINNFEVHPKVINIWWNKGLESVVIFGDEEIITKIKRSYEKNCV
jgi:hypothetical protein